MMRIGYSTATMDMFHEGHVLFIQSCRNLMPPGSKLIIGLTTDELAAKQKRPTTMTYEQRRMILMGFVDDVVPHRGDDKVTAWKKLHFTDVFIGDEYWVSDEYKALEKIAVTVHYIPRQPSRQKSSSQIEIDTTIKLAKRLTIISTAGPGGAIFKLDALPESVIIKPIKISQLEYEAGTENSSFRTANVYNLPIPNPRNFKRIGELHKFPNIPGVNSYRELDIQPLIKDKSWCTTIDVALIRRESFDPSKTPPQRDWSHLNRDKDQPKEIYFVYQKFAGDTLESWIDKNYKFDTSEKFISDLKGIIEEVKQICYELSQMGIVHGDLHATNVCVKKTRTSEAVGADELSSHPHVSIIDFGWCLHRSFYMKEDELAYYDQCLRTNWDWRHFRDALEYRYFSTSWFIKLGI